jgi:Zn finger protein HypA/HybF involved in hydrogenase expression
MHVSTSNSGYGSCTAHITSNRNRAKIYGNAVYLKDKQRFEIELFNPNTINYLAKISINGKSISNSGIVLKPGQRVYLERFIDSNNKFVFETYEIEKSNEALAAVVDNGLVEISFYPEQTTAGYFTTYPSYTSGSYYTNTPGTYFTCTSGIKGNTSNTYGGTTFNNVSCFASSSSFLSDSGTKSLNENIETGKVEKGESSSQNLTQTNGSYSMFAANSISYRLTPESEKPVEVEKLRNYCTGCGNRIKKDTWKFCPSCGEKF